MIEKNTYILAVLLFLILDKSYAEIDTCAEALGLGEELKDFYAQRENFLKFPSSDNVDKLTNSYNDLWKKSNAIPNTELHIAASKNDISAIRFLISNGVPVDTLGKRGVTSLGIAAMHGHVSTVDFLLDLGADVNATDVLGISSLGYAANTDYVDVAVRLLERGANIHQLSLMHETPIMITVRGGHQYMFYALASYGASLMNKDIQGLTLLHAAIIFPEVIDKVSIVKAILNLDRIWPEIINWPEPVYGGTPLHWAAYKDDTDVIEVLLEKGAALTSVNREGELPLHVAAREDQLDAFLMLRKANPASLDVKDKKGLTPIKTARKHNSQQVLSALGLDS